MARPKQKLVITHAAREELKRLSRRSRSARSLAFRARIILRCAEGFTNLEVADQLRTSNVTVGKWRKRFIDRGVDGLLDEPRPGAPRRIDDEQIEDVVVRTLETTPKGATHWSTSLMAAKTGLSASTIGRIWRAFGLQPHRTETFQMSADPLLVEKVRDIVGLYMSPPDSALVLCVDEKSQIQALERSQPLLPMRCGQPERRTNDYFRHGTTTLFAALDVATGRVLGKCYARHRAREFRRFLDLIEEAVPADLDVHIILDNYATHKTPAIQRWLAKRPRFHLHFTPTHASWLNLVERWFALLTQRKIKRGSHRSTYQLKKAIHEFIDVNNDAPKPFVWTKTADEILKSIARFAARTHQAHA
ncbi:MAG: IS630 family transposase [Gammaproteobacteria bacterium]